MAHNKDTTAPTWNKDALISHVTVSNKDAAASDKDAIAPGKDVSANNKDAAAPIQDSNAFIENHVAVNWN